MITLAACLLLLQPANPSAPELVSKMLARHASAETLVGSIRFVQSAQGVSLSIDTRVQYVRSENKVSIRQVRAGASPRAWVVVSDGSIFTYEAPLAFEDRPGRRLYERVKRDGMPPLNIGGVYAAATESLGDRSFPLDLAFGRLEHLRFRRAQWATLEYGPAPQEGVRSVRGQWREYGDAPPSGTYEMWISDSGDLRRYVQRETISAPGTGQSVEVVSTWIVDFRIGAQPDSASFVLPR